MVELATTIWADGPASTPYEPSKPQIRSWGTWIEQIITAFTSNGGLIYSSLAALNADLAKPANSMAWVIGDPVAGNNGVYGKIGASGAGSWTRRSDLPFSFIIAFDAGAGTPNAIQATTAIPVSGSALVWMEVADTNTGSPVTVAFNGGSPLTIKSNSGNNIVAGGLVAGMIVLGIVSGTTFRLVSDQASSAIVAAAEAAADRAEEAAASINIRNLSTRSALKAINTSVTTLVFLNEDRREGFFEWQAGDFSAQVAADTSEGIYIKANGVSASAGAWVRRVNGPVVVEWFGAVGDGTTDNTAAFQCAFDVARYASGEWTHIPRGEWVINGGKFSWESSRTGVRIEGVSMGNPADGTVIQLTGSPTKIKCTRENWVLAYDSGISFDQIDYSASTDDPISWLFKFAGFYCQVNNIAIYNSYPTETVNPPVNWGADYDAGIIYQARYFSAENIRVVGGFRRAALLGDVTQWNGSTDRCRLDNCEFSGNWGHEIMGPKGNAGADLNANDRRGVGGASDFLATGGAFYSIRRNHAPAGGMVRPPWSSTYPGGSIKHSGQAPNTGGKIQGHTYADCRIHSVSRFLTLLDFDSRTAFVECHWEGQSGFKEDGVTPLDMTNSASSDIRIEFTVNSSRTRVHGGEASGVWLQDDQPHLLGLAAGAAYIGGGSRWIIGEVNQDAAETLVQVARGTWVPVLYGATTAGVQGLTATGRWAKLGPTVFWWCDVLVNSKTGTGSARIGGLPLNAFATRGGVSISNYNQITLGAGFSQLGGEVPVGQNYISLTKGGSAIALAGLDMSEIAVGSYIRISGSYLTQF